MARQRVKSSRSLSGCLGQLTGRVDMSKPRMSDAQLVRRLGAHHDLCHGIEALVLAVEDESGELKTADAAEMRVIEMMRCAAILGSTPSRKDLARVQTNQRRMVRG